MERYCYKIPKYMVSYIKIYKILKENDPSFCSSHKSDSDRIVSFRPDSMFPPTQHQDNHNVARWDPTIETLPVAGFHGCSHRIL